MSRPLRIEYAGALYHITSRGDRREAIYRDDEDRQKWLEILAQVCLRFNWRSHAWCYILHNNSLKTIKKRMLGLKKHRQGARNNH